MLDENLATATVVPEKIGGSKKIIAGIIVGVLVLVGAGSAYAYYDANSPEKVGAKMMKAFSGLKSSEWTSDFEVEMTMPEEGGDDTKTITAEFKLDGGGDKNDLESLKAYFNFDGTLKGLSVGDFSLGLEGKGVGSTTYLKLTKAPNLVTINAFFDLKKIENKWISMTKSDAKNIGSLTGIDSSEEATSTEKKLTKEQENKIRAEIEKRRFIKLTKKIGTEKINGMSVRHFQYELDKKETEEFVKAVYKIVEEKDISSEDAADLKNVLADITSFNGELWIGKSDSLIYKMTMNLSIVDVEEKTSGKINATIDFKNYNKGIAVEAPKDSMSIESLMGEIMGSMFSGTKQDESALDLTMPTGLDAGTIPAIDPESQMSDEDLEKLMKDLDNISQ